LGGLDPICGSEQAHSAPEAIMTTILIIVVLFLLLGGGGYFGFRGRR
jgi:hypothetical protein